MRFVQRLPVYATGLGLTVAVAAVAGAREWSGWLTLVVALGVAAFYVVAILVPWLIREQALPVSSTRPANGVTQNGNGRAVLVRVETNDASVVLAPLDDHGGLLRVPATRGPVAIRPSEPRVTVP